MTNLKRVILLTAWLCVTSLVNAQSRNGSQLGNKEPYGYYLQFNSQINAKEIMKNYKEIVKNLKKQYDLKDVLVADAPDGFWYFVLVAKGKKGAKYYGAAEPDGTLIVEPKYTYCYYLPSVEEGVDDMSVDVFQADEVTTIPGRFDLWHPHSEPSFIVVEQDLSVSNDFQWCILKRDGTFKSRFPKNTSLTYYHGYLFFGVDRLAIYQHRSRQCLFVTPKSQADPISLYSADGEPLIPYAENAFFIYNYTNGCNEVQYSTRDEDLLVRYGVCKLGRFDESIPPYFSNLKYDDNTQSWLVKPQAWRLFEPYVPGRYSGINYIDECEKLYYKGEALFSNGQHDEARSYFSQVLHYYTGDKSEYLADASRPWQMLYNICATERLAACFAITAVPPTVYFENLDDRYRNYYDMRNEIPEMYKSAYSIAELAEKQLKIFDNSIDTLHVYAEFSEAMHTMLTNDKETYNNYFKRLNVALADLDTRIANHERELRQMAADRQRQQEEQNRQASAAILNSFFSGFKAGLNSGGSRRTTTSYTSRRTTSARSGSSGGSSSYSSSDDGASSTSSSSSSVRQKSRCIVCAGTGRCKNCNGNGETVYLGTGKGKQKCGNCDGTGKCTPCGGTGYK